VSLYQRYRPSTFDEIAGAKNREVVASLRAVVGSDDPPHAVLFVGDAGTGKTTLGRIVCRELGVSDEDFREINSANFRGIDTVREVERVMHYRAIVGERRCWLFDEVHRWTRDAAEGMLKVLEDPPPHVYFVLCTTDPDKLLPTILSRCVQYRVYPLEEGELVRLLHRVATAEGASLSRSALQRIAEAAAGRPRAALTALQKLIAAPEAGEAALEGAEVVKTRTIELCRALIQQHGWRAVSRILIGLKDEDPEGVRRAVLGYCQSVLLGGENDRAAVVMEAFLEPVYNTGFPGITFAAYSATR
jgi:DNA polymerase III subunit gamma/tau